MSALIPLSDGTYITVEEAINMGVPEDIIAFSINFLLPISIQRAQQREREIVFVQDHMAHVATWRKWQWEVEKENEKKTTIEAKRQEETKHLEGSLDRHFWLRSFDTTGPLWPDQFRLTPVYEPMNRFDVEDFDSSGWRDEALPWWRRENPRRGRYNHREYDSEDHF